MVAGLGGETGVSVTRAALKQEQGNVTGPLRLTMVGNVSVHPQRGSDVLLMNVWVSNCTFYRYS